MALPSVAAGQPIRATHITAFTRWVVGTTKDQSGSFTTTHATEYTLTLTNEQTSAGNVLKLVSGASTVALFNKTGSTFSSPTTFASSVTFASGVSLSGATLVNPTITAASIDGKIGVYIPSANVGTNNWVQISRGFTNTDILLDVVVSSVTGVSPGAGSAECAAIRGIIFQSAATTTILAAGELHAAANSGANITNLHGLLVGIHSEKTAGSHPSNLSGIFCHSDGAFNATQQASRASSGMWIGGTAGWTYGIWHADTDNNTMLYANDRYGNVLTKGKVSIGLTTGATPVTGTSMVSVKQSSNDAGGGVQLIQSGAGNYFAHYIGTDNVGYLQAIVSSAGLGSALGIGAATASVGFTMNGIASLATNLVALQVAGTTVGIVATTGALALASGATFGSSTHGSGHVTVSQSGDTASGGLRMHKKTTPTTYMTPYMGGDDNGYIQSFVTNVAGSYLVLGGVSAATALIVNAKSGLSSSILDLQVAGTSMVAFGSTGALNYANASNGGFGNSAGAAATLGSVANLGSAGPTTAARVGWARMNVTGTSYWVPLWS